MHMSDSVLSQRICAASASVLVIGIITPLVRYLVMNIVVTFWCPDEILNAISGLNKASLTNSKATDFDEYSLLHSMLWQLTRDLLRTKLNELNGMMALN